MRFARLPRSHVVNHDLAALRAAVVTFVSEREISEVMARVSDPFRVDDPCLYGPNGDHHGIGSCGDMACCYCGRVFWK